MWDNLSCRSEKRIRRDPKWNIRDDNTDTTCSVCSCMKKVKKDKPGVNHYCVFTMDVVYILTRSKSTRVTSGLK